MIVTRMALWPDDYEGLREDKPATGRPTGIRGDQRASQLAARELRLRAVKAISR